MRPRIRFYVSWATPTSATSLTNLPSSTCLLRCRHPRICRLTLSSSHGTEDVQGHSEAKSSGHAEALVMEGQREEYGGRWGAALRTYDQAVSRHPDLPSAYAARADLLARIGRPHEAIDAYRQVLRCVPDHPQTCVAVAQCLASLGKTEEALKQLGQVLETHPRNVPALGERGDLYLRRGLLHEATQDYKTIISIDETNPSAWLGLAKVRVMKGHMGTAKKALDLALQFAAEEWTSLQQQQQKQQGEGDQQEAMRLAQQARRRLRGLVAAHSFKAVYLQATGDVAQAIDTLTQAIGLAEGSLTTATTDLSPVEPTELKEGATRERDQRPVAEGTGDEGRSSGTVLPDDGAVLSDLYCKRASNNFQLDRYGDSLRDCDAFLRYSAANHLVRLIRGQCHMFAGRFADAIADLQAYLKAEEARRPVSAAEQQSADVQRRQVRDVIAQCRRALPEGHKGSANRK